MLNADAGPLNDAYWHPTLAHELQHMIRWYQNRNAETWLNEGASMLAQSLNGFDAGSNMSFLNGPDLQLNAWADLSSSLAQGQYGYKGYAEKVPGPTDTITDCPTGSISANVHQFGTRYIELTCHGNMTYSSFTSRAARPPSNACHWMPTVRGVCHSA